MFIRPYRARPVPAEKSAGWTFRSIAVCILIFFCLLAPPISSACSISAFASLEPDTKDRQDFNWWLCAFWSVVFAQQFSYVSLPLCFAYLVGKAVRRRSPLQESALVRVSDGQLVAICVAVGVIALALNTASLVHGAGAYRPEYGPLMEWPPFCAALATEVSVVGASVVDIPLVLYLRRQSASEQQQDGH